MFSFYYILVAKCTYEPSAPLWTFVWTSVVWKILPWNSDSIFRKRHFAMMKRRRKYFSLVSGLRTGPSPDPPPMRPFSSSVYVIIRHILLLHRAPQARLLHVLRGQGPGDGRSGPKDSIAPGRAHFIWICGAPLSRISAGRAWASLRGRRALLSLHLQPASFEGAYMQTAALANCYFSMESVCVCVCVCVIRFRFLRKIIFVSATADIQRRCPPVCVCECAQLTLKCAFYYGRQVYTWQ